MLPDFTLQLISLMNANTTPNRLAALKHNKRRNRLNPILLCESLIRININLHNIGCIANTILHLLKNRRLHLARPTPCSKKVNKRRLLLFYHFIKITHSYIS